MMIVKESNSREDTYRIGRELSEQAVPGQVFCFFGDLGVGKTIFSQGFAKGLGVDDIVNSPTFTIVKEYDNGRLPLYHFDVYRIGDVDEMEEIGYNEMVYGDGVCLIEWANLICLLYTSDAADDLTSRGLGDVYKRQYEDPRSGQLRAGCIRCLIRE